MLSLLLAGGKNSRLYKRLVYDLQIAQDVAAFQASKALNSEYQIVVTARRPDGVPHRSRDSRRSSTRRSRRSSRRRRPRASSSARSTRSSRRSTTGWSASADFGGVGDQLNSYYFAAGNPDYFNEDLSRYRALSPTDIQADRAEVPAAEQAGRAGRGADQVSARTDGLHHDGHEGTKVTKVFLWSSGSCALSASLVARHRRHGPAGARSLEAARARAAAGAARCRRSRSGRCRTGSRCGSWASTRCRPCTSS